MNYRKTSSTENVSKISERRPAANIPRHTGGPRFLRAEHARKNAFSACAAGSNGHNGNSTGTKACRGASDVNRPKRPLYLTIA